MNYEIEGQYSYYSPCGKPKLRVTRAVHRETKEKAFWQEHNEDGRWVKGGTKDEIAPYRFSEWGDKKGTLIQGEGEKKMDRLAQEGFAVTTSPGGANSWRKSLAKYYRGKDVIILPDNDGPGKKYAEQVARDVEEYANSIKIVELPGLQEKEDIHDWLDKGGSKEELTELCENAPFWESKIQQENEPNSNVGFQQEPTSKEYNVFFEDRLNSPKRDILSGELMTFVDGTWQPASSRLDILGSYAYDSFLFKKHRLKEHLARFGETKKPELLVNLPKWDGTDRLRQISEAVHLSNCSREDFYQLLCDWGSRLFKRIDNPKEQNRVIVFQGPQGIGKDYLIDAIVDGLGQFAASLTISNNERDTQAAIGSLIVAKISEFDRTARAEISTLKDLITREHTFIRLPYDRAAKIRAVRCSFIASVNISEILRDHTGNRRFLIFNLEKIDWTYPVGQSLQILAQFKHLAATGFTASSESEEVMKSYIAGQTPEDPKDAILELFDERLTNLALNGKTELTHAEVLPIIEDVVKSYGFRANTIFHILKMNGRSRRKNTGMVYFRKRN